MSTATATSGFTWRLFAGAQGFALRETWWASRLLHDGGCIASWLLLGAVYGTAQLVRGAHYPSHTLWSAWLCWTVCALAYHLLKRQAIRQETR